MLPTGSVLDTDPSGTITDFRNPYLSVKWLYQRRIVMFTITGPLGLTEVVELWAANVRRVLQGWDSNRPYYAIHDISATNFSVSPALVSAIRDLYELRPELPQSIAVITPRNIATQLVRSLLRHYDRGEHIMNGIFFARKDALEWMLARMVENGGGSANVLV